MPDRIDVVIVGGGHNGLVAACYLAMAGRRVRILEASQELGGASISTRPFPGIDVPISPYAPLISLMPYRLRQDLGLNLRTVKRRYLGYAPDPLNPSIGILLPHQGYPGLDASLDRLTGSTRDADAWRAFRARTAALARAVFPTMMEPLRSRAQMRALVGDDGLWEDFVERPIGEAIERTFYDDLIRGMALTDGLIGTFSHAHDPSLRQNRCLLHQVIGNGTGEWEVPVGGMGALTRALRARAEELRVEITTGALVTGIEANGIRALVRAETALGQVRIDCREVVVNCAPGILDRLLGRSVAPMRFEDGGAQFAISMLLRRLPRLRDEAVDPVQAFSGTFYVNDSYRQLAAAHGVAGRGDLPTPVP
ncbi:MAG: phytoene desaturase family protein, partial [Actinomycetales bacterium]